MANLDLSKYGITDEFRFKQVRYYRREGNPPQPFL